MARQKRRKGVEHKQSTREERRHAAREQEAARKLRAAQARQQWQLAAFAKEREHIARLNELARRKQSEYTANPAVPSTEESASNSGDSNPPEA